jgi:hypothetical protein
MWKFTYLLAIGLSICLPAPADDPKSSPPAKDASTPDDSERLRMTPAVACESIAGYQDYVPLEDAVLTKDDKLLIYFEPLNYEYVKDGKPGKEFRADLVVDLRLRKRGSKKLVGKKDNVIRYQPRSAEPPIRMYMSNTIALKTYPPGEYDLEIVLTDKLGAGTPTSQVVRFRIRPVSGADESKKEASSKDAGGAQTPSRKSRNRSS